MSGFEEAIARLRAEATDRTDLGRRFERMILAALRDDPAVYGSNWFADVEMWDDWARGQDRIHEGDIGIDLVGHLIPGKGGGLCAIQCKFYETGKVSTADVDKFLAASAGKRWQSRIFVATGDYTAQARQKLEEAEAHILTAGQLAAWPLDWAALADNPDRAVFEVPKYTPRPDQQTAVEKVYEGLRHERRGRLVMPCGTGKSVMALWIAEKGRSAGRRVLYLVPSISLMDQTMREWAAQRGMDHRYLGVCSDSKVGKQDDAGVSISELAMPVTTDASKLASELKREEPEALTVVFSTYQSLPKVIEAQQRHGCPSFDLAICDEAHRTTGVEADDSSGLFTLVHDDEQLLAERRLYMTATQRIYTDAAKARKGKAAEIYSMDDEAVYGPLLHEMSFGEAIKQGLLTDYEVVVVAVSEQQHAEALGPLARNGVAVTTFGGSTHDYDYEDALKLLGCWDAFADPDTLGPDKSREVGQITPHGSPCRRVIAFSNTVRSSKLVAGCWQPLTDKLRSTSAQAAGLLDLHADHVDGTMNAYQRNQRLQWLREAAETADTGSDTEGSSGNGRASGAVDSSTAGEGTAPGDGCDDADSRGHDNAAEAVRVLSNARCLSEGVDVPALDAVVFLAPRQSKVDIVQAVGRVMRTAPGKQIGYVVLPVLVPEDKLLDSAEVLEGSDFKQVFRVLQALRSHDERLDVLVNSAARAEAMPLRIIDRTERPVLPEGIQQQLDLQERTRHAIASAIVDNVGDRQYWPSWGRRAARVCAEVRNHLDSAAEADERVQQALAGFATAMARTAIPSFTEADAREMLCQHIVTIPVFDAFFAESRFADRNPISRHLRGVLDTLERCGVSFEGITEKLQDSYRRIGDTFVRSAQTTAERLDLLRQVYDGFLKAAVPDAVARLGIVYTPIEIVDFMLRSVDAACRKEFGQGLSDEGVTILDPFTGTGTFLARLLSITDADGNHLIADDDVARKYHTELRAYEITMLPYYLAALQIEETAADRGAFPGGRYLPFEGIALADTFESQTPAMREMRWQHEQQALGFGGSPENAKRLSRFENTPIKVIVGNPPWSAGQKRAGEDNPRPDYEHVAQRVRETYTAKHKEIIGKNPGGNAGGNLYVQAFRWATDRLRPPEDRPADEGWVVAFVHPNSLVDGTSLAGMRACLRDEFTSVYVVNLRGDALKQGAEQKREGDKIFGSNARVGVAITVAVRNPATVGDGPARLHYIQVPDAQSRDAKFAWLHNLGDVSNSELVEVPVTPRHDWVNISDGSFDNLLAVCDTDKRNLDTAIRAHARGLGTDCDAYVYSYSRDDLEHCVRRLIGAYEQARKLVHEPSDDLADSDIEERLAQATVNDDLHAIKWTGRLKTTLRRGDRLVFDSSRIREVLYRPFTKLWLYEDDRILGNVKAVSAMFPRGGAHQPGTPPQEFSSPAHPAQRSSQPSPPPQSPISREQGSARPVEHYQSVDPDLGPVQHGLPSTGHADAAGPGVDQRLPPNPSPATGAVADAASEHPPPSGFSLPVHQTKPSSALSQPERSPISAGQERPRHAEHSQQYGDPDHRPVEHDHPGSSGSLDPGGPALHGQRPADPSPAAETIVVASLNVASPDGIIATGTLADLNVVGPNRGGGRILVRRRS